MFRSRYPWLRSSARKNTSATATAVFCRPSAASARASAAASFVGQGTAGPWRRIDEPVQLAAAHRGSWLVACRSHRWIARVTAPCSTL